MSTQQQWWVRRAGRIDGPLTDREIGLLATQRLIDAATELSRDRQHWAPAARIPGLAIGSADRRPNAVSSAAHAAVPPPLSPATPTGYRQLLWIVGGVVAGLAAIIGLFVGGFLVVAASSARSSPEAGAITADDAQRNATWRYWGSLRTVAANVPKDIRTPEQAAWAVERIAVQIEQLPTLYVDPDAVTCGHTIATFWRDAGQQLRRQNSPALMAESMLRGLSGDPFETAVEELQRHQAFEAEAGSVLQDCRQTRAILTARYGVEFPSLFVAEE